MKTFLEKMKPFSREIPSPFERKVECAFHSVSIARSKTSQASEKHFKVFKVKDTLKKSW